MDRDNPGATFLQIAEHCNREQFNALIGTAYPGIVISDRWNGYEHLHPRRRQVCWSHIQRDFPPPRRRAGRAEDLRRARPRALPPSVCCVALLPARASRPRPAQGRDRADPDRATQLLEHASPKSRRTRWHRRFANNLLKVWPALWTFTTIEGSSRPTTQPNARSVDRSSTERFARHPNRQRRAIRRTRTLRRRHLPQQRRSLFTYLSELLVAHNRGDPFPALA